jgi:2Fe-2S ferredoxin
MPTVTYILADGSEHELEVPRGQTVMDGSVRNNLPGIIAECGGGCSCATCHVYLDPRWQDSFAEATDEELELLEFTDGAMPDSRLSCQLVLAERCDGVRVTVPADPA